MTGVAAIGLVLTTLMPGHGPAFRQVAPLAKHEVVILVPARGAPNPMVWGQQVQCSVEAACSKGDPLTYLWSAQDVAGGSVGTWEDPTAQNAVWTAPRRPIDLHWTRYLIRVVVTCENGKSAVSQYFQRVDMWPQEPS